MKIRLLSLGLLLFDVGVGRAGGTVTARTAKGLAAAAMTQSLLGFLVPIVPRARPAGNADANNGNGLANLPAANNDNAGGGPENEIPFGQLRTPGGPF